MKDYAKTLRYANLTITLIEHHAHRAHPARQERRLQRSYRRLRDVEVADGVRWAPPEFGRAMARFDDDLYLLVVALRQVSRGRELLEHLGHPMPPLRQDAL